MSEPKRALITGAAGFVGKALVGYLLQHGWDVCATDAISGSDAGMFVADVSDRAQTDALLEWAGPVTHVFHLAAIAFVPDAGRDPARAFEVNLTGTINIADSVRNHVPSAKLIYIGSADAYGPPQALPISEEHPLNPLNPYAITKAAADQYCAYLSKTTELQIIRLRPFNHSGPGQSDAFVLSSFARQIAQIEAGQRPPVLYVGNLEAARDFSHVDDIVRAYETAALGAIAGEAYNLSSGNAITIGEALDRLLSLSRASIKVEPDPRRMRAVDVPVIVGSHQKFTQATGWRAQTSFENLLGDLLNYWRGQS